MMLLLLQTASRFVGGLALAPAVFVQQKRRFALCVGISRIPELMGEVEISGSGKFARAGLRQDFNAPESESFVFGRNEFWLVRISRVEALDGNRRPLKPSIKI